MQFPDKFFSRSILMIVLLCLPLYSGVFAQEATEEAIVTVTDANGEEVVIEDSSRIITIGGSVTEIVFALGAGDNVIARDDSSLYPPEVNALESVGYVRTLSAEPVLSLDPTLIITNTDAGPPEAVEQLQAAGVTLLIVPSEDSIEGITSDVTTIATALSLVEEGEALNAQIEADYADAQALLETTTDTPRVMFIYARGAGAVSVAGTNTSAATMIEMAGGENAVTEFEGYLPITAESVVAAAPDVILMMSRGLESIGGVDGLVEQPGIAQTPAGENRRVVVMDDLYLLGFSTRTGTAVLDLAYLMHEELEPPILTILRADGRFNTLLTATDFIGQTVLLEAPGQLTIFAPTDDAFAALPEGMLDGLMSSLISVQAVLAYHVIEGIQTSEDLDALDGESLQTLYSEGALLIGTGDAGITLNETVNIIEADKVASNGVVHVIDAVLLPERPE